MNLTDIVDVLRKDGNNLIRSWFAVITQGQKAFSKLDLRNEKTFYFALRFMVYMACVALILEIPVAASLGLKYDNKGYIISVLVLYALTWIIDSVIFHFSMKIFGGKGSLMESVSAFCFLTAFVPITEILQLPIRSFLYRLYLSNPHGPIANISFLLSSISSQSPYEKVIFVFFYLAHFSMGIYFLALVYRSLRFIHQLNVFRSLVAFLTGIVSIVIYVFLFMIPIGKIIDTAFK